MKGIDNLYRDVKIDYPTIMFEAPWLPFVVCSACKSSSSSLPRVFNLMTNLEKAPLQLTESQLLSIKDRIKRWNTKDQVIDIMRYRYGQLEDQTA